ncbi:hypothetical protein J6590_089750 [Homalodisca vitripennis]|nr:hypothetical protein J6590_089750 [Homalodisca vitripennis]
MFQNIDGCSEVDENGITLWLRADYNGGYEPLTDEEVIASFLPDANKSDAEEADGDIEEPVMSHGDAVTKLKRTNGLFRAAGRNIADLARKCKLFPHFSIEYCLSFF